MTIDTPASFTSFGELLKHLRLRARITQRDLAARVGYNHAHLSRLENNQRVPDAAAIKALFLPALDLEDQPEWAARLLELAEQVGVTRPDSNEYTAQAARVTSTLQSSLPQPITSLLGREVAINLARELLLRPEVRLLTFVGPPGIGKTRLALEVASEVADQFADGVIFTDLTPVQEASLVAQEVARKLEANEGSEDLSASLIAALRPCNLLLLLDNFEQVMDAAPQLTQWLRGAPRLKIVVTSREALHLSGEHEFSVSPLSAEAQVELFAQRASSVQPEFVLTPENQPLIAEICQRLDGLPLAIELAAARIKQFSPQAMSARLDQRLQWLTGGARDGPAWRQTLRGAIDWSYALLSPREQDTWLRMSVFSGGCTPEAAQAVTGAALDDLLALGDKCLIEMSAMGEADEPRFVFLESLREYARERLDQNEDMCQAALHAHAAYYLNLVEAAPFESTDNPTSVALDQLELEYDNLRAALKWAIENQPELGIHLVIRLGTFWYLRSRFSEARRWQSAALLHSDASQRLVLTRYLGESYWHLGEYAKARAHLEESVALARSAQDADALAQALDMLGRVVVHMDSFEAASAYFEEGLAVARAHGNLDAQVRLLRNLGGVAVDHGRLDDGLKYFEESLAAARRVNMPLGIAQALNNAGVVYLEMQDFQRAKAYFLEALPIFQQYGNQYGAALVIINLGRVEHDQGILDGAQKNFETSLRLLREIGRKWSIAYVLSNLGLVAIDRGHWQEAEKYFRESLEISLQASAPTRALYTLGGWAILLARTGRPEEAAELLGLVQNHTATEHEGRVRLGRLTDDLKAALPAEVLEAALQRGSASSWEETTRRCLSNNN